MVAGFSVGRCKAWGKTASWKVMGPVCISNFGWLTGSGESVAPTLIMCLSFSKSRVTRFSKIALKFKAGGRLGHRKKLLKKFA